MMPPDVRTDLQTLRPGDHLCWVLDDPSSYVFEAERFLADAVRFRQRPVVFGPEGSPERDRLGAAAGMTADPWRGALGTGALVPARMFEMFRLETARARDDGFDGIRLMADMDWLLPAKPTGEAVIGFRGRAGPHRARTRGHDRVRVSARIVRRGAAWRDAVRSPDPSRSPQVAPVSARCVRRQHMAAVGRCGPCRRADVRGSDSFGTRGRRLRARRISSRVHRCSGRTGARRRCAAAAVASGGRGPVG